MPKKLWGEIKLTETEEERKYRLGIEDDQNTSRRELSGDEEPVFFKRGSANVRGLRNTGIDPTSAADGDSRRWNFEPMKGRTPEASRQGPKVERPDWAQPGQFGGERKTVADFMRDLRGGEDKE